MRKLLGLTDRELARLYNNPMEAIKQEWMQHGSDEAKATWKYIVEGTACKWDDIPDHVKETIRQGQYHGGPLERKDFDEGHEGMSLHDFVMHDASKEADLEDVHVALLRMYTSAAYDDFNRDLRNEVTPHPFRCSVYLLDDALNLMKQIEAKRDPEAYNSKKILYRGLRDLNIDIEQFKKLGGNELSLMSTSANMQTVLKCVNTGKVSRTGEEEEEEEEFNTIFCFETYGACRGISIQYLSLYPKEDEYLSPPLTYLRMAEGQDVTFENGVQLVPITPTMN